MESLPFRDFQRFSAIGIAVFLSVIDSALASEAIPVSTSPPGGLDPANVPQMIVITFDDAVQEQVFGLLDLIDSHQNPDGSEIPFTFFVNTNDTDYWLVHRLHAAGHEIAAHTMTHTTGLNTDFETWIREIEGCRETLSRFAGIPREEIRGFRAPFLAHNGPMFEALAALGFAYNSSALEAPRYETPSPDVSNFIWPYTLHDGLQHEGWTGTGSDESLPSVLEIPMWKLKEGENYLGMDPGGSRESLYNVFQENFELRYEGNRAPLGIWLHAATWLTEDTAGGLNDFLEWALQQPDVWVVTLSQLENWMRNPVSATTVTTEDTFQRVTYESVPESETYSPEFSSLRVRSINEPAVVYPAPDTAFIQSIPTDLPSTRIEINNDWGGGFEASIIVNNPESDSLPAWTIRLYTGETTLTSGWGLGTRQVEGDQWVIRPGVGDSTIPPGETTIYTFNASGDPSSLSSVSGTFHRAGYPTSSLLIDRGPNGDDLILEWDHVAPIYQVETNTDLSADGWQVIDTLYGRNDWSHPLNTGSVFYRIKPLY